MSTNCLIAIENTDGSVESVYCHWDGYVSYNGNILHNYYDSKTKVRGLIDGGNMSTLGSTADNCEFYDNEPAEKFASVREFVDTVRSSDYSSIEFAYIYTNGAWMVIEVVADTVLPLSYALSKVEEEA